MGTCPSAVSSGKDGRLALEGLRKLANTIPNIPYVVTKYTHRLENPDNLHTYTVGCRKDLVGCQAIAGGKSDCFHEVGTPAREGPQILLYEKYAL